MIFDLSGPSWSDRAACAHVADPATFMADTEGSPLVCARCPVRVECGEHADALGETTGVWGGVDRARRN